MLGRRIARHGLTMVATVLLGGLLSATLVRLAPGFDVDEQQLDPHLNSESIRALRQARLEQRNIFRFYFHSLQRAAHGDLGNVDFAGPTSEFAAAGTGSADAAAGRNWAAAELGGGSGSGAERGVAAGNGL